MDQGFRSALVNIENISKNELSSFNLEVTQLVNLLHSDNIYTFSVAELTSILKVSSLLLQEIVSNENIVISKYSFQMDCFLPIGEQSKIFFSKIAGPHTLAQLRSSVLIGEETRKAMHKFLDCMCSGVPHGQEYVKVKTENIGWQWYQCNYYLVSESSFHPRYALVICRNITSIRNKSLSAQRFRDFMRIGKQKFEIETRKLVLNLEYNLTHDSFESYDGFLPEQYKKELTFSYTKAVLRISQIVTPAQRQSFLKYFSKNRLLSVFSNGITHDVQEFLLDFEGRQLCLRILYQLLRDPYTSCINVWLSCRDATEEYQSKLQLIEQTNFDSVTGIYNRTAFLKQMQEKFSETFTDSKRALIMLDLDGFGKVNNLLGYAYGDRILRDIAHTLKFVIHSEDIVARIGGDEFAIYVNECSDIEAVKEHLRITIAAIYRKLKNGIELSISAGVALFPYHGVDFHTLYEKADIALYYAKLAGKNQYIVYDEYLHKKSSNSMITPIGAVQLPESRIYIRTFGYFDIFVDGEAVPIPNAKAKELLALLVDRRGGYVTPSDIITALWETESVNKLTLARCRKAFMLLRNILKEYQLEDLIESKKGLRRINSNLVQCDLYNYLSGKPEYSHLFKGVYMMNYSWGELTFPELSKLHKHSY